MELIECNLRAIAQAQWIQLMQSSHRHQSMLPPGEADQNLDIVEAYNDDVKERIAYRDSLKEMGH